MVGIADAQTALLRSMPYQHPNIARELVKPTWIVPDLVYAQLFRIRFFEHWTT